MSSAQYQLPEVTCLGEKWRYQLYGGAARCIKRNNELFKQILCCQNNHYGVCVCVLRQAILQYFHNNNHFLLAS